MWTPDAEQGSESLKVKWELVPYTRGVGLDLGCGPHKPFAHFIGVDSNKDLQLFGINASGRNLTGECDKLPLFGDESMDFVFSSHLLEHIADYEAALREWWRVVKPHGYLILYLPHKDFYPNIGTEGANYDHKHDFRPDDIIAAMKRLAVNFDIVRNEDRNEENEYSFFQVFQKLPGKRKCDPRKHTHRESYKTPKPEKTCAIIRYGAYGDCLQTRSVLPGLKAQGYHITWYCSERGWDVLQHDPDIDAFVRQDSNQVPADELADFVVFLKGKYDLVLNFCETVEGVLLPTPDRAIFYWPKAARHAVCDHNYLELQHILAGVPYDGKPQVKFFATIEEQKWAREQREKCPGPVVSIALAGGSVHKVWPHVDTIVARLLLAVPNVTVVLTGGYEELHLAHPWRNEPRVWCKAGTWTMRQTLSFVQHADLVIGPETGVLNAVSMERMAKILFLSHSTVKNLCRDWVNTIAFAPEGVACYPCHQLHTTGFKFCPRHEDGCAVCAVAITADHVWAAVKDVLNGGLIAGRIGDEFDNAGLYAEVEDADGNHEAAGRPEGAEAGGAQA